MAKMKYHQEICLWLYVITIIGEEESKAGFIANGDIVEVLRIIKRIERYGFNFAKATIRMIDYSNEKELDVVLLLDTLKSENPAITYEQYQKLYKEVGLDYKGEKEINKKIKEMNFLMHYR